MMISMRLDITCEANKIHKFSLNSGNSNWKKVIQALFEFYLKRTPSRLSSLGLYFVHLKHLQSKLDIQAVFHAVKWKKKIKRFNCFKMSPTDLFEWFNHIFCTIGREFGHINRCILLCNGHRPFNCLGCASIPSVSSVFLRRFMQNTCSLWRTNLSKSIAN